MTLRTVSEVRRILRFCDSDAPVCPLHVSGAAWG